MVKLPKFEANDLQELVGNKYPEFQDYMPKLLETYQYLKSNLETKLRNNSLLRIPNTRDLLKVVNRCIKNQAYTSHSILQEIYDIFMSSIDKPEIIEALLPNVAGMFNIGNYRVSQPEITTKGNIMTTIGRCLDLNLDLTKNRHFAKTSNAVKLLEQVAITSGMDEPTLLIGETGVGKTTALQFLASRNGPNNLIVFNMSQAASSIDLIGSYKPIELTRLLRSSVEQFLLEASMKTNNIDVFRKHINVLLKTKNYEKLMKVMLGGFQKLKLDPESKLFTNLKFVDAQISSGGMSSRSMSFQWVDGALVEAVKSGKWVLFDEINLAPVELLERIAPLLEPYPNSITLSEKSENIPIKRHPNFRVFAAMNPATDVGKRTLLPSIRTRFTEFYVGEPVEHSDLVLIVKTYLGESINSVLINSILSFYQKIKYDLAMNHLVDGNNKRPHYSLRTLCRALKYSAEMEGIHAVRAVYEGVLLAFLSGLDQDSQKLVRELAALEFKDLLKSGNSDLESAQKRPKLAKNGKDEYSQAMKNLEDITNQILPCIGSKKYGEIELDKKLLAKGPNLINIDERFIKTNHVDGNISMVARALHARRYPILLQGETSTGKTSLINYLAKLTGHTCFRLNNHEHTDLSEYVGNYESNAEGKLIFKEGPLITAMKNGYWIILDELNLAPSDVLEALNRVLDDNREIFLTETQEMVKAHEHFQLFATQNPAGTYAGRKQLSRAFRNRFLELHFSDIPLPEVITVIEKRCDLPVKYATKLVHVMKELTLERRADRAFQGKNTLITLRDLFKWAERYTKEDHTDVTKSLRYDWEEHLANDGFMILAGRSRNSDEKEIIKQKIEKVFKRKIDEEKLYDLGENFCYNSIPNSIALTKSTRRSLKLLSRALKFNEPVLLVGNTGSGKTTFCQIMAEGDNSTNLLTVQCHANTEAGDFIGSLRPGGIDSSQLFQWKDGPLVTCMKNGLMLLIDEISLADDSVIERLNSVLEAERSLLVPEVSEETLFAKSGFQIMATMNPGGDYGKKELSPALANRFTVVWCETPTSQGQLEEIILHNLLDMIS